MKNVVKKMKNIQHFLLNYLVVIEIGRDVQKKLPKMHFINFYVIILKNVKYLMINPKLDLHLIEDYELKTQ